MSTAKTIVSKALRILNLQNKVIKDNAYAQQVAFESLVDMLNMWRGTGLYVVPQIPATINSDLKEKTWATAGIYYELALFVSPDLRVSDFPPAFDSNRESAFNVLYARARQPTEQQYPDTLPIGGGNEGCGSWSQRFYSAEDLATYDVNEIQNVGEASIFVADFDRDAASKGTSVSSVVWEVMELAGTVLSNIGGSGNVSTALAAFGADGVAVFRCRATYANSEIKDYLFKVQVNAV